jgi:hypothetical protein
MVNLGYVYAFTMGDGCIFRNKTAKNSAFVANIIVDNRDYAEWRAEKLRAITGVRITECEPRGFGKKRLLRTESRQHPTFNIVGKRLYGENGKRVDSHALTYMCWEFLAILYQDDGSVNVDKRCSTSTSVMLHTNRYSEADHHMLAKAIYNATGLPFDVRHRTVDNKLYWGLYLRSRFYQDFKAGVKPYILPSFMYKIP